MAVGERIEVQLDNTMRKGPIDHVTADAVYLRRGDKAIETSRERVWRICRRLKGHGGRGH